MKIAVLKETAAGERRVSATPETVKKFVSLGAAVAVERGAGDTGFLSDATFEAAGAAKLANALAQVALAQPFIAGAC